MNSPPARAHGPVALLAVVGLVAAASLSAVPDASGAALSCSATVSVTPSIRAAGLSEQVGDVVVSCTGGTPTSNGMQIPGVNFQFFTNTTVTSRLLADPWGEPLVLLDEPAGQFQAPCTSASGICTNTGNGNGSGYYVGQGGSNVNVFQGKVNVNSITWFGVPFDAPGSGNRVLRFTNIRVNASSLAPGSAAGATPVIVSISASGATSVPIPNPVVTVGFVQDALTSSTLTADSSGPLSTPVTFASCAGVATARVATLRYSELSGTAFKVRNIATTPASPLALGDQNVPGMIYNTETGFYNHAFPLGGIGGPLTNAGLADFGTRLKATFSDVPAGARLFVDTRPTTAGATVAALTADEAGPFSAVAPGSSIAEVPVVNGSGAAVWEILKTEPNTPETLNFAVYVTYAGNTPTPGGTATVGGGFGPTSTSGTATSGPVPRFADRSSPTALFTLAPCQRQGGAPPPPPPAVDKTPPVVKSASASPATFAVDPKGAKEIAVSAKARKPAPKGTTLRFNLSEAGRVLVTIDRSAGGRRSGKRCVAPTRANRKKKKCTRYLRAGRFAIQGAAGPNSHRFSGRIGKATLKPASYRATFQATDAAKNRSATRTFTFKVVSR